MSSGKDCGQVEIKGLSTGAYMKMHWPVEGFNGVC